VVKEQEGIDPVCMNGGKRLPHGHIAHIFLVCIQYMLYAAVLLHAGMG
jgi:hypothetical protein